MQALNAYHLRNSILFSNYMECLLDVRYLAMVRVFDELIIAKLNLNILYNHDGPLYFPNYIYIKVILSIKLYHLLFILYNY